MGDVDRNLASPVSMESLFRRAREERLWFFSSYQQLWFSPEELKRAQDCGDFRWGVANWELRDPRERVNQLRTQATALLRAAETIEGKIGQ